MYNFNALVHLSAMAESVKKLGLSGELQFDSFRFEVAGSGRYFELVPEFLSRSLEQLSYHDSMTPEVEMFAGWRLGARKSWEGASDKLRFKEFCNANHLRTPRAHEIGSAGDALVLLKEKNKPSARRGRIEGPLTVSQTARRNVGGEMFAEEYIDGKSVQAWYFDGRLTCVEIRDKPIVTGDGKRTLRQLVDALNYALGLLPLDWHVVEALALLNDLSLDSRVPAGAKVPVDVRYNSPFHRLMGNNEDVLPQIVGSPVHEQLLKAGPILWQFIPEPVRMHTVFSVRALIDSRSEVWFTDLDPDRYVHPSAYTAILTSLFGLPEQLPEQTGAMNPVVPPTQ